MHPSSCLSTRLKAKKKLSCFLSLHYSRRVRRQREGSHPRGHDAKEWAPKTETDFTRDSSPISQNDPPSGLWRRFIRFSHFLLFLPSRGGTREEADLRKKNFQGRDQRDEGGKGGGREGGEVFFLSFLIFSEEKISLKVKKKAESFPSFLSCLLLLHLF